MASKQGLSGFLSRGWNKDLSRSVLTYKVEGNKTLADLFAKLWWILFLPKHFKGSRQKININKNADRKFENPLFSKYLKMIFFKYIDDQHLYITRGEIFNIVSCVDLDPNFKHNHWP